MSIIRLSLLGRGIQDMSFIMDEGFQFEFTQLSAVQIAQYFSQLNWDDPTGYTMSYGDVEINSTSDMTESGTVTVTATDPNGNTIIDEQGNSATAQYIVDCFSDLLQPEHGQCGGNPTPFVPQLHIHEPSLCGQEDECGTCDGSGVNDNGCCPETGLGPNGESTDCAGECGGSASTDCNDVCGGTAYIDECGECVGGNTGNTAGYTKDCNDECGGSAQIDECGDCYGGTTGRTENQSDLGCGCGEPAPNESTGCCGDQVDLGCGCGQPAAQPCENCDGDSLLPDSYVGGSVESITITIPEGGSNGDIGQHLVDDYGVILPSLTSGSYAYAELEATSNGVEIDVHPSGQVLVEHSGDVDSDQTIVFGTTADIMIDGEKCGSIDISITVIVTNETADCNGVPGGSAYIDSCGECVGGDTGLSAGHTQDSDGCCPGSPADCNGICGGSDEEDCAGICGGSAVDLGCGCGNPGPGENGCCGDQVPDCNGDCGGSAYIDECGTCVGGNTDYTESTIDGVTACCPETGLGPNGEEPDCAGCCDCNAVEDCAGDCGGSATVDSCGNCDDTDNNPDTSYLPPDSNNCCPDQPGYNQVEEWTGYNDGQPCNCAGDTWDCAGVCGGSYVYDECNVCGGTGPLACYDCDGNFLGAAPATVTIYRSETDLLAGKFNDGGIWKTIFQIDLNQHQGDYQNAWGYGATADLYTWSSSSPSVGIESVNFPYESVGYPASVEITLLTDAEGDISTGETNATYTFDYTVNHKTEVTDDGQPCGGTGTITLVITNDLECDDCGECYDVSSYSSPTEHPSWNSTCLDCNGVPNGTHWISDCGCVPAGNSGDDCDDCAGTPNGSATLDDCGECREPGDSEWNSTCQDCAGVVNGSAQYDECGDCDGPGRTDCQNCDGTPRIQVDTTSPYFEDYTIAPDQQITLTEGTGIQIIDLTPWQSSGPSVPSGWSVDIIGVETFTSPNLHFTAEIVALPETGGGQLIVDTNSAILTNEQANPSSVGDSLVTYTIAVTENGTPCPEQEITATISITYVCNADCAGDCNGDAVYDDCGECSGGNSGHAANSSQDCAGTCGGSAYEDECGVCDGPGADACGRCPGDYHYFTSCTDANGNDVIELTFQTCGWTEHTNETNNGAYTVNDSYTIVVSDYVTSNYLVTDTMGMSTNLYKMDTNGQMIHLGYDGVESLRAEGITFANGAEPYEEVSGSGVWKVGFTASAKAGGKTFGIAPGLLARPNGPDTTPACGVTPLIKVAIDECVCTEEYDPVCVGTTTYSNSCKAMCAGYTNSDWVQGECNQNEIIEVHWDTPEVDVDRFTLGLTGLTEIVRIIDVEGIDTNDWYFEIIAHTTILAINNAGNSLKRLSGVLLRLEVRTPMNTGVSIVEIDKITSSFQHRGQNVKINSTYSAEGRQYISLGELECESGYYDECGVCDGPGIPDDECDCAGNVLDCAGICGGDAVIDCNGICGGGAVIDECGVCGGDGTSCLDTPIEIKFASYRDIYGFQLRVSGVTFDDSYTPFGGAAAQYGFDVYQRSSTGMVLGFSYFGNFIPSTAGEEFILTNVMSPDAFSYDDVAISDIVVSGAGGVELSAELIDGVIVIEQPEDNSDVIYGCMDPLACNYNSEADTDDGSCYYAEDFPCGECDSDDSSCAQEVTVICRSDATITGFEFSVQDSSLVDVNTEGCIIDPAGDNPGWATMVSEETVNGELVSVVRAAALPIEGDSNSPYPVSDGENTLIKLNVTTPNNLILGTIRFEHDGNIFFEYVEFIPTTAHDNPDSLIAIINVGLICPPSPRCTWDINENLHSNAIINSSNVICDRVESFRVNSKAVQTINSIHKHLPNMRKDPPLDFDGQEMDEGYFGKMDFISSEQDRIHFERSVNDIAYASSLWSETITGYNVCWSQFARTAQELQDMEEEDGSPINCYKKLIRKYSDGNFAYDYSSCLDIETN